MAKAGAGAARTRDRRFVLWVLAGMFVLMVLFVVFGPKRDDDDPQPTVDNSGTHGARAAYLLLGEIGYQAQRWDKPETELRNVDAAHTTLVLAEPILPLKGTKELKQAIAAFLQRGGRVLATGESGALLLPGGSTGQPTRILNGLCYTRPQGTGTLAQAGEVPMRDDARWSAVGAEYRVEQRCGADAVVVRYKVGEGEAVWWSSPQPLTNEGLSDDPSLRLMLASVGAPGRTVLFDEYLHTFRESIVGTLKGLPWWALLWQAVAAALLLLLSRSRRSGPLRMPVVVPRSSPVEFALSMGQLYAKAGATQAATEAARGRLLEYLREHCGIPREMLAARPGVVGQALTERFGGDWSEVDQHLEQAEAAARTALAAKSALALVRRLDEDLERLRARKMAGVVVG